MTNSSKEVSNLIEEFGLEIARLIDERNAARAEVERLRDALLSVRSEVDLRKAPKLMAKIEFSLGTNPQDQP